MKKMFFAILLLVMGILFSSTAFAGDDKAHGKEAQVSCGHLCEKSSPEHQT